MNLGYPFRKGSSLLPKLLSIRIKRNSLQGGEKKVQKDLEKQSYLTIQSVAILVSRNICVK